MQVCALQIYLTCFHTSSMMYSKKTIKELEKWLSNIQKNIVTWYRSLYVIHSIWNIEKAWIPLTISKVGLDLECICLYIDICIYTVFRNKMWNKKRFEEDIAYPIQYTDLSTFTLGLHPNKPIIGWKYVLKVHLIHLTYQTS